MAHCSITRVVRAELLPVSAIISAAYLPEAFNENRNLFWSRPAYRT